jgi:hypothetical protein
MATLSPEAVAAIAEKVRVQMLRWLARSRLIEPHDVHETLGWSNGGSSLDSAVRMIAPAGLARSLLYWRGHFTPGLQNLDSGFSNRRGLFVVCP